MVDYQVAPPYYLVRYTRVIDGIEYPGNSMEFDIDKSGKVAGKFVRWDKNVQLPDTKPAFTAEEARAKFAEQAVASISRAFPAKMNEGETKMSIYEYRFMANYRMDASTGKAESDFTPDSAAQEQDVKALAASEGNVQPVDSEEKALKRATELAVIPANADKPLIYQNANGKNDSLNGPFWRIVWWKSMGLAHCSVVVEIQQSTGELTWYWNNCQLEGNTPINEDEAKQKAADYVAKAVPQAASVLTLDSIQQLPGDLISLIYAVKLSGVDFGTVAVRADTKSGEIKEVDNGLDGALPTDIPKFDEAKLKAMLMKAYDVSLAYYTPPLLPVPTYNVTITEDPVKPVLVYNLVRKPSSYNFILDAKDAVWRHFSTGEAIPEDIIEFGK